VPAFSLPVEPIFDLEVDLRNESLLQSLVPRDLREVLDSMKASHLLPSDSGAPHMQKQLGIFLIRGWGSTEN